MALEFLHGESVAQRLKARAPAQGRGSRHDRARRGPRPEGRPRGERRAPRHLPGQPAAGARLDGSEIVKVMDFGIAKAVEEASSELTANMFLGKLEYASPEQCGFGLEHGEHIDLSLGRLFAGGHALQDGHGPAAVHGRNAAGLPHQARHRGCRPLAVGRRRPRLRFPASWTAGPPEPWPRRASERQQSMAELIDELKAVRPCSPRRSSRRRWPEVPRAHRQACPGRAPATSRSGPASGTTGAPQDRRQPSRAST